MRKAFKLAVAVGGIGALVWSMRKRVRIAVRRGEGSESGFQIIEPAPEDPAEVEGSGEAGTPSDSDSGDDPDLDTENDSR